MAPERRIDAIIVHCSDTPDQRDGLGAVDIEQWHRERAASEPWSSYIDGLNETRYIGYHFVITREGEEQYGRPVSLKGCHTAGFNAGSIGVCWMGRARMEAKQRESLIILVAKLCIEHGLEAADVYPHNHFNAKKTCPNFNSQFTFESIEAFRKAVDFAISDIK